MDEILYETLNKYYKALSVVGYKKDPIVNKLLVMQYIQETLSNEYRYYLTKNDIKLMQDLLYQFIGSTCEISFPTNYKCCCGTGSFDPSITGFSLVPSTTNYVGSQSVTFTGARFNISKGTHIKEDSLKIYWGTEVLAEGLNVDLSTVIFNSPIVKELVEGQTYTAKASVLDEEGNEYFSNTMTITCTAAPITNPTITNFKLVPSTTTYTGTQDVTFTGATFTINKGTKFKEDSLEIVWGTNEVMGTGLSTAGSSITFSPSITKNLVEGNTYTAKASIQDIDGNKYYSNTFTITVKTPVNPTYMYTGNQAAKPTVDEIKAGTKYDYNNVKQFNTPAMMLKTIWVCIPATVTLVSMENVNFSGDYIYNIDTGRDYMKHEDVTIDGVAYKLTYLTTIASHNPYKTIVR